MAANAIKKYRPSFTASEISTLIALVRKELSVPSEESPHLQALLRNLLQFEFKVQTGFISPAFTMTPKLSVEESLGIVQVLEGKTGDRKSCYGKYISYPELCSPEEILQAKTYMYENDLMTPQQEAEFEMEAYTK